MDAGVKNKQEEQQSMRFGSDSLRTVSALDAGANRPQQERRQMRVIGSLRFRLALRASRLCAANRRYAGGWCRGRWRKGLGRGLRLRIGIAAGALGVARFALPVVRPLLTVARPAFTPRLAVATRAVRRTFLWNVS